MTVLSQATARLAHADPNGNAFDIKMGLNKDGNEVGIFRVVYTDFDGNKTTEYFEKNEDATRYPKIIEGFWNVIDAANKCDKTDKDRLYQSILDSMKQLVNAQGKSFLPHDVKKAMNEIEGYFNIELTVW